MVTPADGSGSTLTIHLVRHGQTDWNREGRLQGWTDIPLNQTGIEQARAAAARLANRPVGAVISSDLSRARRTAEFIAEQAGVELSSDPALRERSFGVAEGELDGDLNRRLNGRLDECWADPDFSFEGGESRRYVYDRVGRFLGDLLSSPPSDEIVLVSHGGALRVARGFLEQIPVERLPRWEFGNGEVTTLVVARPSSARIGRQPTPSSAPIAASSR